MSKAISKRILLTVLAVMVTLSMMPLNVWALPDAESGGSPGTETEAEAGQESGSRLGNTPTAPSGSFTLKSEAVHVNTKNITISWKAVQVGTEAETPVYAHHYRVLMKTENSEEYKVLSASQIVLTFTYKEGGAALKPGAYTFIVEAWAGEGTEPAAVSNEHVVQIPSKGKTDAPQKLKSYSTYKGIDLEWKPVEGNKVKYNIYRKLASKKEYKFYKQTSKTSYYVRIPDKDIKKKYSFVVTAISGSDESVYSNARVDQAVRTISYSFTLKEKKVLNCHCGGHKKTMTFKAGRRIKTCDGFSDGLYYFWDSGHRWRVNRISTKDHGVAGADYDFRYTNAEAERYVNRRGLSSGTKYLMWTNLYGQHLYIFKGSKGKWKLYKDWQVSTGKPSTPTSTGLTEIKHKSPLWHTLKHWSLCYVFSFHSKAKSWPIGKGPKSGGCVRNYPEKAEWIYYNCAKHTRVCIY